MAEIDDLVERIKDSKLRREIQAALAELKQKQSFGLVYEQHAPETVALFGLPVQPGSLVIRRDDLNGQTLYRVMSLPVHDEVGIHPESGGESQQAAVRDLLVIKPFGEPIYPTLTPLGAVRRGGDKPHHAVINAENYHALQLLLYLYEGQVDCIYIDPPYNTGARDWKYNNRYVDANDSWRHSKWLSMIPASIAKCSQSERSRSSMSKNSARIRRSLPAAMTGHSQFGTPSKTHPASAPGNSS